MEDEKDLLFAACESDEHQAVGHLQRFGDGGFEAFFDGGFAAGCTEARAASVAGRALHAADAIHDGFDGVVLALVERERLGEVDEFAVDAGAKALLIKLIEHILKFALAAAHDRGHDGDPLAGAELQDALDDLLGGLARRWGGRSWGSAACRPRHTAGAGSRRSR